METKKRIEFIDLAKGVCILLVIMMHTDVNVDFPGLRGMRMPLYFILSGLFFKDYGGFLNLLVKKANKILIPFLFFYLASYSIFYLIGSGYLPILLKARQPVYPIYSHNVNCLMDLSGSYLLCFELI